MTATFSNFCGMIVSETRGGVERDYVPDTLGSTAARLDSSQTMTGTWEYYPYGEVAARTGTHQTDLTFVGLLGYFRDVLDKLLYVRARHLRVDLTRWLTVDPLWPRQSAFAYAKQEPTVATDWSGLLPACVLPCACAAACVIDLLAVCADWSGFPSYRDCLEETYKHLPTWLQLLCGACIAGCIVCFVRSRPAPPPRLDLDHYLALGLGPSTS